MAIEMLRPPNLMLTQTSESSDTDTDSPAWISASGCHGRGRSLGLVQLLVLVASVQPAGCAAYQHLIVGLLLT